MDVTNRNLVESALSNLPANWQTIDALINNAGLALSTDPLQIGSPDQWDTMLDTNVKGLLYVTHQILPGMIAHNQGHIINIGSMAGGECYPGGNVYCATKHAVRALTKSMRLDLLGTQIRVTELAPGAVETELSEIRWHDKTKAQDFYKDFNPLLPEDIADAALYCLTRPAHVDIAEMLIMPTVQASANYLHRGGRK